MCSGRCIGTIDIMSMIGTHLCMHNLCPTYLHVNRQNLSKIYISYDNIVKVCLSCRHLKVFCVNNLRIGSEYLSTLKRIGTDVSS